MRIPMSDKSTTLETISEVRLGEDAHIRANRLPLMTGSHEADLNCGNCAMAIVTGVTPAEVHERFQTDQRLIVECICGTLNVIPR
jgi:hypothetical protein